jgi:dynamin 1-like protein
MDQLIPLLNELQDVFTAVGSSPIQLPQLIVVGSQSSGKSSVLENLVGRDFLPRGSGIVTRRPLILQLINNNDNNQGESADFPNAFNEIIETKENQTENSGGEEYGEFLHRSGQKFYDFNDIREEIIRETERLTGLNKGVSAVPISLKIFSPKVLTLTLVDLPGITKVPVGDQPDDIELQIREMILAYITNPNSIIIAVTAANTDIANSDALKLAREVDPLGARTLGVITKIDLMDRGTDALNILIGNIIQLQHGFVGVVNRSQHDINKNKAISAALKAEKQFFQTHSVYRSISNRLGTNYLARRLNSILLHHIHECLPEMRAKINSTIQETQAELESYGKPLHAQSIAMGSLLLPLISKFCLSFNDSLEGRSNEISVGELYGGARISYVFRELFSVALESIQPFDILSDFDIRTAIRNASGPRPSLFIPEISFELLVKKQIERLLIPALDCVDLVYSELQRVSLQCEQQQIQFQRFPKLRYKIMEVTNNLLKIRLEPTKNVIQNLIHCELSYINTNHPDFIGGSKAVASIMERIQIQKQEESNNYSNKGKAILGSLISGDNNRRGSVSTNNNNNNNGNANLDNDYNHNNLAGNLNSRRNLPNSNSASSLQSAAAAAPSSAHLSNPSNRSGAGFFNLFRSAPDSAPIQPTANSFSVSLSNPLPSIHSNNSSIPSISPLPGQFGANNGPMAAPIISPANNSALPAVNSLFDSDLYPGMSVEMRVLAPTDRELIETEVIKTLISSYFNIVRKNICDYIPKAIMGFLVNHAKKELQSELVSQLYQPTLFDSLMREAEDISEKRASCEELLSILRRALEIINQARDFNPLAS